MTETVNRPSIEQQIAGYRQFAEEQAKEGYRVGKIVLDRLEEEYQKRLAVKESPGKKILIIDCSEGIGLGPLTMIADQRLTGANCRIIDFDKNQELPVDFTDVAGVIITGSPADTNEKETKKWIGQLEKFIRKASDKVPVFGICFGKQVQEDAVGREIINLKKVDERGRPRPAGSRKSSNWGLNKVSLWLDKQSPHRDHPLFRGLKFQEDGEGNRSCVIDAPVHHSYSVKMQTGAAETDRKNLIGVEYPENAGYAGININGNLIGVQFHPERLTEIGFLCAYTVAQVTGEGILNSNESSEEKLRQLQEWEKRLARLKRYKEEWIDGPKKEETPPGLKIFQNFVSSILGVEK